MKIAYIGIDMIFPALQALKNNNVDIIKIFTCKTDNITEFNLEICNFAKEYNIPLQMTRITLENINDLKKQGCELIICGGYYYKIPVTNELPMVNIHPSLLPYGRGAWPMPRAILDDLKETGITMHKISAGFDEGDIILQRKTEVLPNDNLETLTNRLLSHIPEMIKTLISDFDNLYSNAKPQGYGEYQECVSELDYPIFENSEYQYADLVLRAFYGYECIYKTSDKVYSLIKGVTHPESEYQPGDFKIKNGIIKAEKVIIK